MTVSYFHSAQQFLFLKWCTGNPGIFREMKQNLMVMYPWNPFLKHFEVGQIEVQSILSIFVCKYFDDGGNSSFWDIFWLETVQGRLWLKFLTVFFWRGEIFSSFLGNISYLFLGIIFMGKSSGGGCGWKSFLVFRKSFLFFWEILLAGERSEGGSGWKSFQVFLGNLL